MSRESDVRHLRRCVDLARGALDTGSAPFGSLLVDAEGNVRGEDHNRTSGGDETQHPEFALARWAADNLSPRDRAAATVYTSGEHCAMCAAAHAWVGLGPIVYASSTQQIVTWLSDLGVPPFPIAPLAVNDVAPGIAVRGPFPEFEAEIHGMFRELVHRAAP
ncbi:nucleoside deaminase [Spiractinospora alimapuensis]|uniref:nucleoside deaminase n=1 Tax=Spiractinospora alimapuensis TaxID=2820884 RepID=UPI001F3780C3|nr:nucleoside deaminase [Spiractinospora alimapuensis]QVQ51794.1 nucleoside deaminase [Spiractinospora alimapuensis]